jgi:thioester reductase-like protein
MSTNTAGGPTGAAGPGNNVFLTGGTGFLGTEIVNRVLRSHPRTRLTLLVRSTQRETARERVDRQLVRSFGLEEANRYRERIDVVNGDISLRGLGIDDDRLRSIQSTVDQVIHCAAAIRFDLPLDVARRDNTEGTRNVLAFAERLRSLGRFDYIGTAFVAGDRRGVIKEDELDLGQRFRNSYEQTKMEAEQLVRAFAERYPTAIFRPGLIVGNSQSGETTSFQVFYQAVLFYRRLFARRLFVHLPADPNTPFDLVPVDYVLDAFFAIMGTTRSLGRCFHLTSGPGNTCTLDELLKMVADFTGVPQPPYVSRHVFELVLKPILLAYGTLFRDRRKEVARKAYIYMPYFWSNLIFDKTNTDSLLEGTGITTPHPRSYFLKLLEYQARM